MPINSLGYVGIRSRDLEEWQDFAENLLGMQSVESGNYALAFRMDDYKQRLMIETEPGDVLGFLGWEVDTKDDLEIYLYSNVETPDQKTKIFKQFADQWSETSTMTDVQLARQIAEDRIDIAVYLAGRFNLNRVEIAAYRPAPVQVSFHDCATTGLDSMDYWLTDGFLHPEETDEKFTEELFRLPVFYQFTLPDPIPDITPTPYLENGYVTFGSFSKPEKISEEVVSVWGNVLKNTENSKLLLRTSNCKQFFTIVNFFFIT